MDIILNDNEKCVYKLIRNGLALDRGKIAQKMGISRSLAEMLVNNLIDNKLLIENRQGKVKSGRKAIPLQINFGNYTIIDLLVDNNKKLQVALSSMTGAIIKRSTETIEADISGKELLRRIDTVLKKMLTHAERTGLTILGIGIGVSGIVNQEKGELIISTNYPNCRNTQLKDYFEKNFQLPVAVEELCRTYCLAEVQFGIGRHVENFLYLEYGDGIGLGLYINGRLFCGSRGLGGEFGHIIIDPLGPICTCGAKGCLEAVVGGKALVRETVKAVNEGVGTSITDENKNIKKLNMKHVFEGVVKNDRLALTLVDSALNELGRAVGNLCNILNPAMIVIGGVLADYPSISEILCQSARKTVLPQIIDGLKFEFSSVKKEQKILGAGELLIRKLFYNN